MSMFSAKLPCLVLASTLASLAGCASKNSSRNESEVKSEYDIDFLQRLSLNHKKTLTLKKVNIRYFQVEGTGTLQKQSVTVFASKFTNPNQGTLTFDNGCKFTITRANDFFNLDYAVTDCKDSSQNYTNTFSIKNVQYAVSAASSDEMNKWQENSSSAKQARQTKRHEDAVSIVTQLKAVKHDLSDADSSIAAIEASPSTTRISAMTEGLKLSKEYVGSGYFVDYFFENN
jgi:hypothetical protein